MNTYLILLVQKEVTPQERELMLTLLKSQGWHVEVEHEATLINQPKRKIA